MADLLTLPDLHDSIDAKVTTNAPLKANTGLRVNELLNDMADTLWNRITDNLISLTTHTGNTTNPHSVTKAQVGLSAVTNDAQLKAASNLGDLVSAATARTNLGVAIGTDVQAYDADLAAIAALATTTYGRAFLTLADAAAAKIAIGGVTVRTYTGTTDTLVLADANNMVRGNNTATNTCTIPPNSSVAFPIGTQILFSQYNTGNTVIAAGAGVTVNSYNAALKLMGQYAQAMLTKVGTDEWSIDGNLKP